MKTSRPLKIFMRTPVGKNGNARPFIGDTKIRMPRTVAEAEDLIETAYDILCYLSDETVEFAPADVDFFENLMKKLIDLARIMIPDVTVVSLKEHLPSSGALKKREETAA